MKNFFEYKFSILNIFAIILLLRLIISIFQNENTSFFIVSGVILFVFFIIILIDFLVQYFIRNKYLNLIIGIIVIALSIYFINLKFKAM